MMMKAILLIAVLNCIYLASGAPPNSGLKENIELFNNHRTQMRGFQSTLKSRFQESLQKRAKQINEKRSVVDHFLTSIKETLEEVYQEAREELENQDLHLAECIASSEEKWRNYKIDVEKCLNSNIEQQKFNDIISSIEDMESHLVNDMNRLTKCNSPNCIFLARAEENLRFYVAKKIYSDGDKFIKEFSAQVLNIEKCKVPTADWENFILSESETPGVTVAQCMQEKIQQQKLASEEHSTVNSLATEEEKASPENQTIKPVRPVENDFY